VPPVVPPPPPPPPPGTIPPFPGQLIRRGSQGESVAQIQRCLNAVRGRFPSIGQLNPDGVFGPLTEASVREFQRLFGLNPDGIVGPLTWGMLMPACNVPAFPGFLIRLGARGDYVRQIQTCLNNANSAGLTTDGIFGPITQNAVIAYQRAHGLTPDGVVGPITWGHLMSRCGTGIRIVSGTGFMPSAIDMPATTGRASIAQLEQPVQPAQDTAPRTTIVEIVENVASADTSAGDTAVVNIAAVSTTATDTAVDTMVADSAMADTTVESTSNTSADSSEKPLEDSHVFQAELHMYHLFKDMEK